MKKTRQTQEIMNRIEETVDELETIRAMNDESFECYLQSLRREVDQGTFADEQEFLNGIRDMDDDEFDEYITCCMERTKEEFKNLTTIVAREPDEKQNGTVVAFQQGHKLDGIKAIAEKYPWVDIDWLLSKKRFYCVDKPVAKMICHPDDVFNQDVGEELALKRLDKIINGNCKGAVKNFERYIKRQLG